MGKKGAIAGWIVFSFRIQTKKKKGFVKNLMQNSQKIKILNKIFYKNKKRAVSIDIALSETEQMKNLMDEYQSDYLRLT